MTPIEILALSRIVREAEEKLARGQVSPGTHSVDVVVHVSGLVEVEKDYEKRPTVSVPWTEAYALLREVAIRGVNDLIARMDGSQDTLIFQGSTLQWDHVSNGAGAPGRSLGLNVPTTISSSLNGVTVMNKVDWMDGPAQPAMEA